MTGGLLARVYVTPKRGVLDPQGKAVARSLGTFGFDEVADVRIGRYLEVRLEGDDPEAAERRVKEMCERLLANLVIEDYRFEILPGDAAATETGR